LLKPTWGIAEKGGRSKGKSILSSIHKDKIEFKILKKSNILLIVKTGPGNDYIQFEFSHDRNHGKWHVISEYTDL
tara:strand:- start:6347 stop:6571 length:225 start_codon:yes stop_codon:yes gene_type:complete